MPVSCSDTFVPSPLNKTSIIFFSTWGHDHRYCLYFVGAVRRPCTVSKGTKCLILFLLTATLEYAPVSCNSHCDTVCFLMCVVVVLCSCVKNERGEKLTEGNLKLASRYRLLTACEANSLGPIPNNVSPSDHYPLLATFFYTF